VAGLGQKREPDCMHRRNSHCMSLQNELMDQYPENSDRCQIDRRASLINIDCKDGELSNSMRMFEAREAREGLPILMILSVTT